MIEIEVKPEALPGILGDIARLTTPDIAILIARTHGGGRLYIPREVDAGHPIARLVGLRAAQLICHAFGGDRANIPSARHYLRWYDARKLFGQGRSHAQIAKVLGLNQRRIKALLEGVEPPIGATSGTGPTRPCPSCGRQRCSPKAHRRSGDERQLRLFN